MPISFHGKSCAITGALTGMTRAEASQRLIAAGATVSATVSSKTDYLIAGAGGGHKIEKARMRGTVILNEAQLLAALEGRADDAEALATPPKAVARVDLNDALVAFRELLYDTPDANTWDRACQLLDACDPAALPMAADYVTRLTEGWGGDLLFENSYYGFPRHHKGADLRQTPQRWLEAIMRGEDSPKLRVCRVLNAHNAKLTGTVALNLFKCSNLQNTLYLSLGRNNLSGAFFKALRQSPLFARTTHLSLDSLRLGAAHAQAWQGPCALTSLTRLSLAGTRFDEEAHLRLFLEADAWQHLTELHLQQVQTGHYGGTGEALRALTRFQALTWLELSYTRPGPEVLEAIFDGQGVASLRHLKLASCNEPHHRGGLAALARAAHIQGLEYLDIYGCQLPDDALAELLQARHLGTLRFLGVSGNHFGAISAAALRDGAHLGQLQTLNLTDCALSVQDATRMLQAPHLASLERLTAQTNTRYDEIDDTFPRAIAAATGLRLQHLYASNLISDDALLALATAPHMASLQTFHLRDQPRDPAFKKRLLQQAVFSDTIKATLERSIKTTT